MSRILTDLVQQNVNSLKTVKSFMFLFLSNSTTSGTVYAHFKRSITRTRNKKTKCGDSTGNEHFDEKKTKCNFPYFVDTYQIMSRKWMSIKFTNE